VKEDLPYLVYVRDSIAHIEKLTPATEAELTAKSFEHSLAAILYYLHTLAEATQRISVEAKTRHTDIDW
jgi:uncharacterized protein with HEPN domain